MKRWLKYFLIFGGVVFILMFIVGFYLGARVILEGDLFAETIVSFSYPGNPLFVSFQLGLFGFLGGGITGLIIWFLKLKVLKK